MPNDTKVYVAGQTANKVYVIDARTRAVLTEIPVGAAPVGIVAAPDSKSVYVISHEAARVTKIDARTDSVTGMLDVSEHPWGASISADGKSLFVSHLLLGAGVTTVDLTSFTVKQKLELAEEPQNDTKTIPQGVVRGVYSVVPHPLTGVLWAPHLLLAIHTPEPALDFQSTVFPAISTLDPTGASAAARLNFTPIDDASGAGAFNDVVSGPRAIAFSPDGALALVADSQSEDVLVFDANLEVEIGLVRPLPAAFLEGITVDHAGRHAYVHGRNSENVVVLDLDPSNTVAPAVVAGDPIATLAADPMPEDLRHGQRLFYTANSAAFPITQNFWVACSSCHLEGYTDAVTWRFFVGPRDTPSNGGGPINTGFLLRQALRNSIADYDTTIQIEQGGSYHRTDAGNAADLMALSDFVNFAIPFQQNPNVAADGTLTDQQTHGKDLFLANCRTCHTGEYLTDSGTGNPTLDLNGPIMLHDIGTCVTVRRLPRPGGARRGRRQDAHRLRLRHADPARHLRHGALLPRRQRGHAARRRRPAAVHADDVRRRQERARLVRPNAVADRTHLTASARLCAIVLCWRVGASEMPSEITGEQAREVGDSRITTYREFWPFYVREHRKPITRALHFIGSTLVLAVVAAAVVTGRTWLLALAPLFGYGFAWVGHFGFEKNRPATFKYPLWSLVSDWVMYGKILSGTMRAEVERALAK